MTRRRPIGPKGHLTCSRCGKLKHISEFYQLGAGLYISIHERDEYGEWADVWYGKPMSWCKQCVQDHRRGIPAGIDDLVSKEVPNSTQRTEKIDPLDGA